MKSLPLLFFSLLMLTFSFSVVSANTFLEEGVWIQYRKGKVVGYYSITKSRAVEKRSGASFAIVYRNNLLSFLNNNRVHMAWRYDHSRGSYKGITWGKNRGDVLMRQQVLKEKGQDTTGRETSREGRFNKKEYERMVQKRKAGDEAKRNSYSDLIGGWKEYRYNSRIGTYSIYNNGVARKSENIIWYRWKKTGKTLLFYNYHNKQKVEYRWTWDPAQKLYVGRNRYHVLKQTYRANSNSKGYFINYDKPRYVPEKYKEKKAALAYPSGTVMKQPRGTEPVDPQGIWQAYRKSLSGGGNRVYRTYTFRGKSVTVKDHEKKTTRTYRWSRSWYTIFLRKYRAGKTERVVSLGWRWKPDRQRYEGSSPTNGYLYLKPVKGLSQ